MAYVHLEDIGITGIAVAVPKNVINNRDLAEKFGEKHINKFIRTTGVIQRRIASEHQTASDLGLAAAQELLAKKGIDKSELVHWFLLHMVRITSGLPQHMFCKKD